MMKRYIFNFILLIGIVISAATTAHAQAEVAGDAVQGKVTDLAGSPIAGAKIFFDSGSKLTITDENGDFKMTSNPSETVLVEAKGYETVKTDGRTLSGSAGVKMTKNPIGLKSADQIQVPFGSMYSRQLTGAVTSIDVEETMKSDYSQNVKNVVNGRVPGFYGTVNSRSNQDITTGLVNAGGNTVTVVDGIPRVDFNLNLSEVETVTVLKDIVTRALYGAQAADAVILITTKRGEAYKREMNFSAETGISTPISYPVFLNSADYMEHYNQALRNDGLPEKYSADAIAKTRSGEDKIKYPDENYYNSTYLRNMGNFTNITGEASGGNSNAQYYLNMGWKHNSGLLQKIWDENYKEGTNTFNVRGNVDYQINSFMKMKIDGIVFYENNSTPRFVNQGNQAQTFYTRASSFLPNYYPVLIDASLLSPDQQAAAKLVDGKYVLGGTSEYPVNIYGEMAMNGYNTRTTRILQNNTSLDFDLKGITEGLTARAYLTFDMNNEYSKYLNRTYAVYQPTYKVPDAGGAEELSFTKIGVDQPAETPTINNVGFYRRVAVSGQVNYVRDFNNMHKVNVTGVAYTDFQSVSDSLQDLKSVNLGLRANYMLKNKYVAELGLVTSGSAKLDDNKWGTSPNIGLAWIVSEEGFLKDSRAINYLKIRANAGSLKTDRYSAYRQYMSYYTGGANSDIYRYGFSAFSNSQRTVFAGNPEISWAEKKEISLGFESLLVGEKLHIEATWFNNKMSGIPYRLSNIMPGYVENTVENYGEYTDKGVEWGVNYTMNLGKTLLTLGHNGVFSTPTRVKDNVVDYAEPWRKRTGIDSDAIFGLEDQGFYSTSDFNANGTLVNGIPIPTYGEVKPGDIKYADYNNDGLISDKDEMVIGNSTSRMQYCLYANLKAGNFELFVLGTGQTGAERIFSKPYDWVYADRKYSELVRNSWTEATAATATYPRLSSKNSPNNFRNSTFWLTKDNFFTLHTAQLTYNVPYNSAQKAAMKAAQIYLRGTNLFTISDNKERRERNPDTQPQMRYYSIGIVASF
jgi:TonB-linked SusC/RagA family outer membrane protein